MFTPPFVTDAAASAAATWGSSWFILRDIEAVEDEDEEELSIVVDAGADVCGRLLLALLNMLWL